MKIVINTRYGGFSLSPKAVKRLAELRGQPCYFFNASDREPVDVDEVTGFSWSACTVPDPDAATASKTRWASMTPEERAAINARCKEITLSRRPDDRSDPLLVQVVEELGEVAIGQFAELKIVEIPDGVEWEISDYDGLETVEEKHRFWN